MTYSELIQLYFERSNALQGYWTIYVVVIGGLLAFSSLRKQADLPTTTLISILFVLFAFKNLGAIHDVSVQRFAILDAVKLPVLVALDTPEIAELRKLISPSLIAPAFDGVQRFHIISDLLTLAALWAMELGRRKKAKAI